MGRENGEKVQDALYRIAELASAAQDMQEFYRAVHEIVGELTAAEDFFIALYDEERQRISWPYFVDELDPEAPDPHQWFEFGQGDARGVHFSSDAGTTWTSLSTNLPTVPVNDVLLRWKDSTIFCRRPENSP